MEAAYYTQMANYAKTVLPHNAFLEPHDIVIDAYIKVGSEDRELLRKTIRNMAFSERSRSGLFVPIYDNPFKSKAIVETSKVCNKCGQDKGFASFRLRYNKNGPGTYYLNTCKECELEAHREYNKNRKYKRLTDPSYRIKEREQWKNSQSQMDPEKYALYMERKRQRESHRYHNIIKNDPVRFEKYKEQQRRKGAKRRQNIKNDPERLLAFRERSKQIWQRWKAKQKLDSINTPLIVFEGWQVIRNKIKEMQKCYV